LESFVSCTNAEQNEYIKALEHIAVLYPGYDQENFRVNLRKELLNFLQNANDFDDGPIEDPELNDLIEDFIRQTFLVNVFWEYYGEDIPMDNFGVLVALEKPAYICLRKFLDTITCSKIE
jgi:hypothetical protein